MKFQTFQDGELTIHVAQSVIDFLAPSENEPKPVLTFLNLQLNKTYHQPNNILMKKYRKKPVIITAVQWDGKNFDEVMNFMGENGGNKIAYEDREERALKSKEISIRTEEGIMTASKNDYIIKGIQGEFYPCKPDIFKKSYEEVI